MAIQQQYVVAIARFTLWPNRERAWLVTWQALAKVARSMLSCRRVRLLADATDHTRRVVLSEWDSREAFDSFWRGAGITWIEDALEFERTPTDILIFAVLPSEEIERRVPLQ